MGFGRSTRTVLTIIAMIVFAFIYVPMAVIVINSFNAGTTVAWPPSGFSTIWWEKAFVNPGVREALLTSIVVAIIATIIALVLGTLASLALSRTRFFGQDAVSLLIILPIALPGIVTGIALNNVFTSFLGGLTFATLVIGHATFCVVVVYNNALARLRRLGQSLPEASADLGAGNWTTFRLVTFPLMRSAIIAGAVLAFGLSFDEIIVTTFTAGPGITTLPIWIYQNLFRPSQGPIVNVVAAALVVISILPVYIAQKLSSGDEQRGGGVI